MKNKNHKRSPAKKKKSSPPDYHSVVRVGKTAEMLNVDDATLRRLEAAGHFQKRFKINPAGGPKGAAGHTYGRVIDFLKARAASASDEPEVA